MYCSSSSKAKSDSARAGRTDPRRIWSALLLSAACSTAWAQTQPVPLQSQPAPHVAGPEATAHSQDGRSDGSALGTSGAADTFGAAGGSELPAGALDPAAPSAGMPDPAV